jgi:hypothetical protein
LRPWSRSRHTLWKNLVARLTFTKRIVTNLMTRLTSQWSSWRNSDREIRWAPYSHKHLQEMIRMIRMPLMLTKNLTLMIS